jgi:amidase
VADTALMLSAIAGPDARSPLSYDVDTRALTRAVRAPSIAGWRVAWTPDLNGLLPVHADVARVAHDALRTFRDLGARVDTACPDFSGVHDIVRATRAVTMIALHADKLARWRERMQPALVRDIEQSLTLPPHQIARGEVLRSALWHRVRAFMASRDLLILPTVALPPFPVEQAYPAEINGVPLQDYTHWFFLTYAITLTGLPAISVPCGFTRDGLPVGLQIVGGHRQDAAVLRAAAAFWADRVPPVVAAR